MADDTNIVLDDELDEEETEEAISTPPTDEELDLEDDADVKSQSKPVSALDEEDSFSDDTPSAEYDLDNELKKAGLKNDADDETPTALGLDQELDDEVE